MKTGAGFLHLNTPKNIQYTAGCVVSARDIEASKPKSRVGIIKLPSYMHHVRKGIDHASSLLSLKPLLDDQEDAFDLPLVKPLPLAAPSTSSNASEAQRRSIDIVVHHLESGKQTFKLQDFDGVMEEGEVPMIVKDEEDEEKQLAIEAHTVYPWTMTDEERAAYYRLMQVWRAKSASGGSGSSTGPSSLLGADPVAKRHRVDLAASRMHMSSLTGNDTTSATSDQTASDFFDDIEFAIRLAEDALR
ncbi:Hypothetical protein, putative [Bodo saltans]|uniref:Uncharacterized protein n=1 Tax=Bodo saltans TaxID=75058 RepID=A0A0S4INV7_BODSA|nr:Hypothetical protein, putative [Bodo saltans]|eukprot:CUF73668.1 Hypothetical protein, putative [Bodo saltans]